MTTAVAEPTRFAKADRTPVNLFHLACRDAHEDLAGVLPEVAEYVAAQAKNGLWHPCYAFKLLELHRTLEQVRPKSILEIGCGATTSVFARYAKESGATVVSVDGEPKYIDQCRERLGELADYVTFKHWPASETGECLWCLQSTPSVDLLYVDGPANPNGRICADAALLVECGSLPGLVLFDYRIETARDFAKRFSDLYRIEMACFAAKDTAWYLSGLRHHTFAWRR